MPRNDPLTSVLRALDVLELVGMSKDGIQMKWLEEMLKPRVGALHVLLQTLVERGYLVKLQHPVRYMLGPALETVNQKRNQATLVQQVGPIMCSISHQCGMQVTYQKLIASHPVVLMRVKPELHHHVELCDWYSASYGTSIIFQAYMSPEAQERFWEVHPMNERAQKIWGTIENLREYLKLAAKQKLVIIDSRADKQLRVSGPIFDIAGNVTSAISAIQHCDKITPQQAQIGVQLIYRAALRLSSPQIFQHPSLQPTEPVSLPAPADAVKLRPAESARAESRSNQQHQGENRQTTGPMA